MSCQWVRRGRDVYESAKDDAKPVLYAVRGGWMVSGIRSAEELAAIALLAKEQA